MRINSSFCILVRRWLAAGFILAVIAMPAVCSSAATNAPAWITKPLSLADCLNLALSQNSAILKSQRDFEAACGVVLQTRAVIVPKVRVKSDYQVIDEASIERFPLPPPMAGQFDYPDQRWSANVQLIQSIYEGGRLTSAWRTAKLVKEQAFLSHQAVMADTLLEVRVAYADVLLTTNQIKVQKASVELLKKELEDVQRRFEAGTVPRFNVLRAAVQLTNAMPRLIRAQNGHRIAKNNLANLLGYNVPKDIWEDLPLQLTDELEYRAYQVELPVALAQALERRPELGALRKAKNLRQEAVVAAKAGYKPSVQLVGGYGSRNSSFSSDLSRDVSGWFAGGQLTWDIFDGLLTKGKVKEAQAHLQKAQVELDDVTRRIELEVRTAYSNFIEAREVLDAQREVEKLADEALRLARARAEAGTGTQLDVLSAETALTEARTTHVQALRDYAVACARLERAVGQPVWQQAAQK